MDRLKCLNNISITEDAGMIEMLNSSNRIGQVYNRNQKYIIARRIAYASCY